MNGYVQSKNHFSTRLFIGLVLALAMLLCVLPAADAKADVVGSGTCGAQGDNLTWTLDDEGLLTISGTGAMADYYPSSHYGFGVMTKVNVGHVAGDPDDYYALGVTMLTAEGKATYYNTDIRYNVVLEDEYVGDKYLGWLFNYNISASGKFVVGTVDDNTRMLTEPDFGFVGGNDTGFVPLCPAGNRIEAETDKRGILSNDAYQAIDAANVEIEGMFADYLMHSSNAMKITEETVIFEITTDADGVFKSAALGDPADYIGVAFTADQISIFAWDDKDITVLFVVNPFSPGPNDGSAAPAPGEGGDESAPGDGPEVPDDFVSDMNAVSSRALGETGRAAAESGAGQEQDVPWASLRSGIERVVIEDGVTYIGANAFTYCGNLNEVSIPASVTSIGENAFYGCRCPDEVSYGGTYEQWKAIEIGEGNDPLLEVEPRTLEEIDSGTCGAQGDNLTWVLYSDGKLVISGTGAMKDWSSYHNDESGIGITIEMWDYSDYQSVPWESYSEQIDRIVLENGVTSIGIMAFILCRNVVNITIPESVASIGYLAFWGCDSLTAINADRNNTVYSSNDGVLFNKGETTVILCPCGKSGSYIIPDSVTSIGDCAFFGSGLTSVTIPSSVTSIGDYAFEGCGSLTGVTIPESVTSIGDGAFRSCSSLTSVTIPSSVTSIGDEAFRSCSSLTGVIIPASVTSIGDWAFFGCSSLTNIDVASDNAHYSSLDGVLFNKTKTELICCPGGKEGAYSIPESVTGIGDDAFRNCSSLTSVTIPASVTSIGDGAFRSCSSLTSVTIPDSVTSIGSSAFYGCSNLTSVTIPASVTSIGDGAFTNCDNLTGIDVDSNNTEYSSHEGVLYNKDITMLILCPVGKSGSYIIPGSVTRIGDSAFEGCYGLNSVTIPDGVISIGGCAFSDCVSLVNVTIPDSVTSIGEDAFIFCRSLTSVTIPYSVTRIGDSAFYGCRRLTDIYYEGSEEQWNSISIGEDNAPLLNATIHFREIIDSGTCGDNLTWELDSFGVLTISGTGEMADYSSNNMPWYGYRGSINSVTIEDGVTSIGNYAFYNCSSLTSVIIPDGVTGIGERAFRGCSSLTSMTIPDSVISIGSYVFQSCSSLIDVTIQSLLFYSEYYAGGVFQNCPDDLTVYGYSGTWLEGWCNDSGVAFSDEGFGKAPNWIDGEYAQPTITGRTTMHITSAEDLAWLAQYVNAGHPLTSYKVVLEADIDLSGKLWTPIGTDETSFGGVFDGQGHTISGMTISMYDGYSGLFRSLSSSDSGAGRVCNLCLADAKITSNGSIYPIANAYHSSLLNCGVWGWASREPSLYSDLAWSSFDTPDGNYSRIYSYQKGTYGSKVTADYLRSAEFLDWINSYPCSGMYAWVTDADGSNNSFSRMTVEPALRNWVDVAETVADQNNVYDIYTPQQLSYIASLVNGGNTLSGKTVRLQADLDLSAYYWTPMSTLTADFDGNDHSITGLKVGNEDFPCLENAGLIGTMNGNVTLLTISGDVISSSSAGMIAGESYGNVTDCHGSGTVVNASNYTGGLIGTNRDGNFKISGCSFNGTVKGPISTYWYQTCGGIVGYGHVVEKCSFSGSISGGYVGGIAGSNASISLCFAVGTLNGVTVGGICGSSSYDTIENCYSICDISGSTSAGGLIGELGGRVTVRNCYVGGSVGGAGNIGALFGDLNDNSNNTYENVYWNQDGGYTLDGLIVEPWACGNGEDLTGVTALTAEQMRQQSSFAGFDFDTVWAIDPAINDGMPYLRQDEVIPSGYTVTLNDFTKDAAAIDGIIDGGKYTGEKTFTVSSEQACVVAYKAASDEEYTVLAASGSGTSRSFTVQIDEDTEIFIGLVGDVDLDGGVGRKDATLLSRFVAQWKDIKVDPLTADIDGAGGVARKDATLLSRRIAGWTTVKDYFVWE